MVYRRWLNGANVVDCGMPSMSTSALRPRSVCERELVVLLDSAIPGTNKPRSLDISGSTLLIASICSLVMMVTVAAAFVLISGMRVELITTSLSETIVSEKLGDAKTGIEFAKIKLKNANVVFFFMKTINL